MTKHFISHLPQFVRDVRGHGQRLRTSNRREVGKTNFEMDNPPSQSIPPKPRGNLLRQIYEPGSKHLQIVDILLERRFMGD